MQVDPKAGIAFLNNNLLKYFQNKEYSIEGMPCCIDVCQERYKTYSIGFTEEMVGRLDTSDKTLPYSLKTIKEEVDKIIDGLIVAKRAEKPEGLDTIRREVDVHWRRYPSITSDGDFLNQYPLHVTFRLSLHHKP